MFSWSWWAASWVSCRSSRLRTSPWRSTRGRTPASVWYLCCWDCAELWEGSAEILTDTWHSRSSPATNHHQHQSVRRMLETSTQSWGWRDTQTSGKLNTNKKKARNIMNQVIYYSLFFFHFFLMFSKLRYPMFWQSKLPKIVKASAPLFFPRLSSVKPRRLEIVGGLSRSISQVSSLSKPTRSQLKRSLSIVTNRSMNISSISNYRRSRSTSQPRAQTLGVATLTVPSEHQERSDTAWPRPSHPWPDHWPLIHVFINTSIRQDVIVLTFYSTNVTFDLNLFLYHDLVTIMTHCILTIFVPGPSSPDLCPPPSRQGHPWSPPSPQTPLLISHSGKDSRLIWCVTRWILDSDWLIQVNTYLWLVDTYQYQSLIGWYIF